MNTKKIFCTLIFVFVVFITKSQSDNTVVATVGDLPISVGELNFAYSKSIDKSENSPQTLDEFFYSYLPYKRKIVEALHQKLDTVPSLKREYQISMDQLEEPYLKDTITTMMICKEVYDRLGKNFKIKDIAIGFPFGKNVFPKDTLEAYNIAMKIKSEIDDNGDNYDDVLAVFSTHESIKNGIGSNDYGWITSLMVDFPMEQAIYNLNKKGKVSNIVRSNRGYHIFKIEDERPDIGIVGLSSILLAYPDHATESQKDSVASLANHIYSELGGGTDFNMLHKKYSSDISLNPDGNLGTFGVQRPMSDLFLNAIQDVPVGGYTKPIPREYGIHIIRVNVRLDRLEWNAIKNDISNKLQDNNNQYQDVITEKRIEVLSKKIPYKINNKVYKELQLLCDNLNISSDEFFNSAKKYLSETLLSVDKQNYTVGNFIMFVKQNPDVLNRYRLTTDQLYFAINDFIYSKLIYVKKQSLLQEYPVLANLSKEYFEGLLYYSLMSNEVWDKALQDKGGLSELFAQNKKDYAWDSPRFEGLLVFTKDARSKKEVQNFIDKNKNNPNLLSTLISQFNKDGKSNIIVERGFWSKGENAFIDNLVYNEPQTKNMEGYPECFVEGELIKKPRTVNDIKGQVVQDYQKILERQLDDALEVKYPVEINQEVLDLLIEKEK